MSSGVKTWAAIKASRPMTPERRNAYERTLEMDESGSVVELERQVAYWRLRAEAAETEIAHLDKQADGVWVYYGYDMGPYVHSIHDTEIDALRAMNLTGYDRVIFVPFGADFADVVNGRHDG